eukprot:TRINITY_DN15977_c0_g2_i1.p1 TRINITY_DN15977_c0_g2~~TRINITY_DN15977_c0_g2_i1.p1  ORF type:complete len:491 (+),score=81.08 TRINITY_DN15977_c0_g2_i1:54-1475(+)
MQNNSPEIPVSPLTTGFLVGAVVAGACLSATRPKRRKKILILGGGTRGDVEPLIVLGEGLERAGCEVTMGVGLEYKNWQGKKIPWSCMTPLHHPTVRKNPSVVAAIEKGYSGVEQYKLEKLQKEAGALLSDRKVQEYDLIVSSAPSLPVLLALNHLFCTPCVLIFLQPWWDSQDFPPVFDAPDRAFQKGFHKSTVAVLRSLLPGSEKLRRFADETFTPKAFGDLITNTYPGGVRTLHAYPLKLLSPVGPPRDYPASLIDSVVGYVRRNSFLVPSNGLPDHIATFLNKCKEGNVKVAYLGYGSMTVDVKERAAVLGKFIEALKITKMGGVVQEGWAGFCEGDIGLGLKAKMLPPLCFSGEVSHDALFPCCDVVLHHGGAGTTAAALLSGTPSLVTPLHFDQAWHADAVARLSCGLRLRPLTSHTVSPAALAQTLTDLTHLVQVKRSRVVARELRQQDGLHAIVGTVASALMGAG